MIPDCESIIRFQIIQLSKLIRDVQRKRQLSRTSILWSSLLLKNKKEIGKNLRLITCRAFKMWPKISWHFKSILLFSCYSEKSREVQGKNMFTDFDIHFVGERYEIKKNLNYKTCGELHYPLSALLGFFVNTKVQQTAKRQEPKV